MGYLEVTWQIADLLLPFNIDAPTIRERDITTDSLRQWAGQDAVKNKVQIDYIRMILPSCDDTSQISRLRH